MSFVLILEDEKLHVQIISDLIQYKAKVEVVATDSVEHALELAKNQPILIISDIRLDGRDRNNQDGIKFVQTVKSSADTSHIPVILRSSMPLEHFNITLKDTKANIFLSKSMGIEKFVEVVNGFL